MSSTTRGQYDPTAAAGELARRVLAGEHADRMQDARDDQHHEQCPYQRRAPASTLVESNEDERDRHVFDEIRVAAHPPHQGIVAAVAEQRLLADASGDDPPARPT